MSAHISKEIILKYAADRLGSADRKAADLHMAECVSCSAKVAHVLHKAQAAGALAELRVECAELQNLFGGYADGTLGKEQMESVRGHIGQCDSCLEQYEHYLDQIESIKLPHIEADSFRMLAERAKAIHEVARKYCKAVFSHDDEGNLLAHFSCDLHDLSAASAVLAFKERGTTKHITTVDIADNRAHFGRIHELPGLDSRGSYSVTIANAKKK